VVSRTIFYAQHAGAIGFCIGCIRDLISRLKHCIFGEKRKKTRLFLHHLCSSCPILTKLHTTLHCNTFHSHAKFEQPSISSIRSNHPGNSHFYHKLRPQNTTHPTARAVSARFAPNSHSLCTAVPSRPVWSLATGQLVALLAIAAQSRLFAGDACCFARRTVT
jgi:hypothetical protein